MSQELAAKDFGSPESMENEGILDVFPVFHTAPMGQKIRCPDADELFRVSLDLFQMLFPDAVHPVALLKHAGTMCGYDTGTAALAVENILQDPALRLGI